MKYYPHFLGGKSSKMKRYFKLNKEFPIGHPQRYPIENALFPYKVDISFGSTKPSDKHVLRINTSQAIRNCSNKVLTKNILKDKCPIVTKYAKLSTFIVGDELHIGKIKEQISFPLVAKLIYGYGGIGMYFISTLDDLLDFLERQKNNLNNYFLEEYFNTTNEYRVHISPLLKNTKIQYKYEYGVQVNGKWEIKLSLPKVYETREILSVEKKFSNNSLIRNRDNGAVFFSNFSRPDCWEKLIEDCFKAAELLGVDFCCFDVLYNKDTGKYVICEANSNPGMDNSITNPSKNITAQHYQQMFPYLITNKYLKVCAVSY